ncbi:hypothetical protein Dsui_0172 [Azospira oryzae PS]|uniref:ASCH domain-containing protein n=1 Tax=Azospira oryzae (strain ATCC BAA-33 / DSM 13638 / PS) TaxID=640081 RepID=G8QM76_AZOOP|nr:hypothetical protein [Azospira oryzae]AEV24592.1 hypothetical protein Dsui_0172 [Azospira oryzae PS]
MKERPILFSGPMVRAILEGRKTQTRRAVKPQPEINSAGNLSGEWLNRPLAGLLLPKLQDIAIHCPYGQSGDRLWVREACIGEELESGLDGVRYPADNAFVPIENTERAAINWLTLHTYRGHSGHPVGPQVPSIHMPRWASRILLEITGVRVERLQDITPADCVEEGYVSAPVEPYQSEELVALDWYRHLWESINGLGSWAANPWVWVVEFRTCKTQTETIEVTK